MTQCRTSFDRRPIERASTCWPRLRRGRRRDPLVLLPITANLLDEYLIARLAGRPVVVRPLDIPTNGRYVYIEPEGHVQH